MALEISLQDILNKNINEHKAEIKSIGKSSLISLKNPVENGSSTKWKGSYIDTKSTNKKISNKSRKPIKNDFINTMFSFSLGSDCIFNKEIDDHTIVNLKPIKLNCLDNKCHIKNLSLKTQQKSSNGVQCNEFPSNSPQSSELFDLTSHCVSETNKRHVTSLDNKDGIETLDIFPHSIHPRYQTRYTELMKFRKENIQEKRRTKQGLLGGNQLIHYLENRLKMKLDNIRPMSIVPNFERLQVYREIFEDLISESKMFGSLLSKIKTAYDAEIDTMLEMPVPQKELLQLEMDQLKQSIYHRENLENIQLEIIQVEQAIKMAMETEQEYEGLLKEARHNLQDKIESKFRYDEEMKTALKPLMIHIVPKESEKLEALKTQCWKLMDQISGIQKETKSTMTSRATIDHLTAGLQDVTIEAEKLNYHKQTLESEVETMEKDLTTFLEESDVSDQDQILIQSLLGDSPTPVSRGYQESVKWSWYIS